VTAETVTRITTAMTIFVRAFLIESMDDKHCGYHSWPDRHESRKGCRGDYLFCYGAQFHLFVVSLSRSAKIDQGLFFLRMFWLFRFSACHPNPK